MYGNRILVHKLVAVFAVSTIISAFTIFHITIYKNPVKILPTELLPAYSEGEKIGNGLHFVKMINTNEQVRKYVFALPKGGDFELHFSLRDENKPCYVRTKYFNVAYKSTAPLSQEDETLILKIIESVEKAETFPLRFRNIVRPTDTFKTWALRLAYFVAIFVGLLMLSAFSSIRGLIWNDDPVDTRADNRLFAASNPKFKAVVSMLAISAAAFIWFFFATDFDRFFSSQFYSRTALWCTPIAASGFAVLFIISVRSLLKESNIPRSVAVLLTGMLVVSLIIKIALPDKLPFRPVDELDMVIKGSEFWRRTVESLIPGHSVNYYPFRPNGHSILLSTASVFGPVTFKSAIYVNIVTSTLILLVVFLLCLVLFGRPWLALLCSFFLGVNDIFNSFSITADYSISALFYSLAADLFIASYLRRGGRCFLPTGFFALVLAVQSRPEYILYPIVIFAYLFFMAKPESNRKIAAASIVLILALPHFIVFSDHLKNQPVISYFNDGNLFTATTFSGKLAQMVEFNLKYFPNWLTSNGTSVFYYALAAFGVLIYFSRYTIQVFILILPVAVLFFGILTGNSNSFTTINYSINFQPYISILAGLGVYSFTYLKLPKAIRHASVFALTTVLTASSFLIYSNLNRKQFHGERNPLYPTHCDSYCARKEISFLQSVKLDTKLQGKEAFRGFLEAATGVKTEQSFITSQIKRTNYLYYYDGLSSSIGMEIAPYPNNAADKLHYFFDYEPIASENICGKKTALYLLKRKNNNR